MAHQNHDTERLSREHFQSVALELGLGKGVGTRACCCLMANDIWTYAELATADERPMFRWRNLGPRSLRVIREVRKRWLAEHTLPTEPDSPQIETGRCAIVRFRDEVNLRVDGDAIAIVVSLPPV